MTPDVERVPPHDIAAERATLGAILVRNEHLDVAAQIVAPSDFYREAHRLILRAMLALRGNGAPIDFVTLKDGLSAAGQLEKAGGPAYLVGLIDGVPHSVNVGAYAGIVRDRAVARDYCARLRKTLDGLYTSGALSPELLADLATLPHAQRDVAPPLLDDAAVLNQPEPEWLVAGMIPARALVALIGDSGVGKTFVGIDLGLFLTCRHTWLGSPVGKHGSGVYVAAEGAPAQRIGAWKLAHEYDVDQPLGFHTWSGAVQLLNPAEVTAFIAATKPLNPAIVKFDTLARCLVGGDENSARDMGLAIAALDRIRTELDTTVAVLHHTNRAGTGERGSGALRGACDTMLSLTKADDLLQLSCVKLGWRDRQQALFTTE